MSIRIAGLGIGVVLLSVIWAVGLLFCLVSSKRKGIESGLKYILLASLPTIILLVWPRNSCSPPQTEDDDAHLPIDFVAIPRITLAAALIFFVSVFGCHYIQYKFLHESHVKPTRK